MSLERIVNPGCLLCHGTGRLPEDKPVFGITSGGAVVPSLYCPNCWRNEKQAGERKTHIEWEHLKEHDAQVAKAAREQAETTDNIIAVLKKRYRKEMAILDYIEMIECEVVSLKVESLRAQQQGGDPE
jgi:hypothetical protein